MSDISNIKNTCNVIAETFFDKTPGFNGCIITLRLYAENDNERDSFYHLAYYGRANYKLVLGLLSDRMSFFSIREGFSFLSYHDSCWRTDSYYPLEKIFKDGKFRKVVIDEITPVNWAQIEFSISSNYDSDYFIDIRKGEGTIKVQKV